MSETTAKLSIANVGMMFLGHEALTAISDATPLGKKVNAVFEKEVKYLMTHDWYFNRERKLLSGLTAVHKLEVDTAPTPAIWSVGATLTGATSAVTCTVKKVLSDTIYLVTEPSDDFTDGEIISDGTNSVDCATNYPVVDEDIEVGEYPYAFTYPSDYLYNIGISDYYSDEIKYRTKREGDILLSQIDNSYDGYYRYNKFIGTGAVSTIETLPEWFHRLISARLAYILSANITENQKIRTKIEIEYETAWREAKEANGEDETNDELEGEDNWNDSVWSEMTNL